MVVFNMGTCRHGLSGSAQYDAVGIGPGSKIDGHLPDEKIFVTGANFLFVLFLVGSNRRDDSQSPLRNRSVLLVFTQAAVRCSAVSSPLT